MDKYTEILNIFIGKTIKSIESEDVYGEIERIGFLFDDGTRFYIDAYIGCGEGALEVNLD